MGLTYIEGTLRNDGQEASVTFLVDSGARYTVVPHDVWRHLGLTAERAQEFVLADGTIVERSIAHCQIELPQGRTPTPVILGEPGDEALLGVVTLEELGLVLYPFSRELRPMRAMLA